MTPEKPPGRIPPGATGSRKPKWMRKRPGRMTNSLVALSSAAIISVYGVGYLRTQAAEDQLTANPSVAAAAIATATAPSSSPPGFTFEGGGTSRQQTAPLPTATPAQPSSSQQNAGYKDGTYSGSGTSRHGGVEVSVVVQGGKIASAAITSCSTRYPCSKIAALPGQVVSKQSAAVNYVSGSTDSSKAYKQAVTAALAQAA